MVIEVATHVDGTPVMVVGTVHQNVSTILSVTYAQSSLSKPYPWSSFKSSTHQPLRVYMARVRNWMSTRQGQPFQTELTVRQVDELEEMLLCEALRPVPYIREHEDDR